MAATTIGAIGILEIQNYGNALLACDVVSKCGDFMLIHNKRNLGGRLVTLVFQGDQTSLQAAFERVREYFTGTTLLKVCEVVPNPRQELLEYFSEGDFKYDR